MKRVSGASLIAAALAAASFIATAAIAGTAAVGKSAPEFSSTDLQGKTVKLSDYRGKYVVLEWVNPGCPFVQKHYDSGNMPRLQKEAGAHEVVWLSINSTNPSHGDYKTAAQMGAWMKEKGAQPAATLLDTDGKVGKLYGAKATPDMFVIDPKGTVIYSGAIDDKRSADPQDVKTATNYVTVALDEARAGKPVSTPATTPYGCSIKYGS